MNNPGRTQLSRADFLRAIAVGEASIDELAEVLGFERRKPISSSKERFESKATHAVTITDAEVISQNTSVTTEYHPTPLLFWQPQTFRLRELISEIGDDQSPSGTQDVRERVDARAIFEPLAKISDVLTRLRRLVEFESSSGQLDVRKLVAEFSRGRIPSRLPHLRKQSWGEGLYVVQDLSARLIPYRIDQGILTMALKNTLPKTGLILSSVRGTDLQPEVHWPEESLEAQTLPRAGSTVLVLGDLGVLDSRHSDLIPRWRVFGEQLTERRVTATALVPCDVRLIPDELARVWTVIPWERGRRDWEQVSRGELKARASRLLALMSFAVIIEPRLLRRVRRAIPEFRGFAELEALVWQQSSVRHAGIGGALLKQDHRAGLDKLRAQESETFRQIPVEAADAEHACEYHGVRFAEILNLGNEASDYYSDEEIREAKGWFLEIDRDVHADETELFERIQFFRMIHTHLGRGARDILPAFDRNWARYVADDPGAVPPPDYDPSDLRPTSREPREVQIHHAGSSLRFQDVTSETQPDGSLLACVRSRVDRVRIDLELSEIETISPLDVDFWADGHPPPWAGQWGTDEFGPWVELAVGPENLLSTQRMRWIPAGTFWMGSPEDEAGRDSDEGPRLRVTLSRGYWMFDTPCTQLLWQSVMGENPSEFKSPNRPVENVSWQDCQEFLRKVRHLLPSIEIELPTEAEWEYACRAGTETASYNGPVEILGESNAPALDAVAWYGGNSGVHFELDNGWDAAAWPEKQFEFEKAGTHPVAKKEPNAWGLYDMLGNVWEWCRDGRREYSNFEQLDPVGPEDASAERVIRGGSWLNLARSVRAAYRAWIRPGYRDYFLGFRCRVQSSEPSRHVTESRGRAERGVSVRSGRAEPRGESEPASEARTAWISVTERGSDRIAIPDVPALRIITDIDELTLRQIEKPPWASAMGRDPFGLWAEFEVPADRTTRGAGPRRPRARLDAVRQRLRWIPPGRFMMGSPKDEPGRLDGREFLPTEQVIEHGFWLFDTPCTQELWETVMGENPSYFKSPTRPVEQVSWDDCAVFVERMKSKVPSLELALPTEAEWEYACRAGTKTATYAGSLEILGDANAPVLDSIAWYGGNCGVDFELAEGVQVTWLKDKQHAFDKGGTHPVARKRPNAWGLFDMLGNVWEWCQDPWSSPTEGRESDASASAERVFRGGSWSNHARLVRAAYRGWYPPEVRNNFLGFRCRVQEGEQRNVMPSEADLASAERRSRRAEPGGDSDATSTGSARRGTFDRIRSWVRRGREGE